MIRIISVVFIFFNCFTSVYGQMLINSFWYQEDNFVNEYSTDFDGTNDYMLIPKDATLDFGTGDFSFAAWIKPDTDQGVLLRNRSGGAAGARTGIEFEFRYNPPILKLSNTIIDDGNGNYIFYDQPANNAEITPSIWTHVAFTWKNSTQEFLYYVNGVIVPITPSTSGTVGNITSPNDFWLGRYSAGLGAWEARIDEVVFFNKALSAAEVSEIYNLGLPADLNSHSAAGNLISWWRMGDGDTFPTVTDQVGSNDGTLTNMQAGDFVIDTPP